MGAIDHNGPTLGEERAYAENSATSDYYRQGERLEVEPVNARQSRWVNWDATATLFGNGGDFWAMLDEIDRDRRINSNPSAERFEMNRLHALDRKQYTQEMLEDGETDVSLAMMRQPNSARKFVGRCKENQKSADDDRAIIEENKVAIEIALRTRSRPKVQAEFEIKSTAVFAKECQKRGW